MAVASSVSADAGDAQQVAVGAVVYRDHCATCHGANLEGQPEWKSRTADGRLPAPPHDETGHTWHHSDETLFGLIKVGLQPPVAPAGYKTDMPAFGTVFDRPSVRNAAECWHVRFVSGRRYRRFQANFYQTEEGFVRVMPGVPGFVMRRRRQAAVGGARFPFRLALQLRSVAARAMIAVDDRAKRDLLRVAGISADIRRRPPRTPPAVTAVATIARPRTGGMAFASFGITLAGRQRSSLSRERRARLGTDSSYGDTDYGDGPVVRSLRPAAAPRGHSGAGEAVERRRNGSRSLSVGDHWRAGSGFAALFVKPSLERLGEGMSKASLTSRAASRTSLRLQHDWPMPTTVSRPVGSRA